MLSSTALPVVIDDRKKESYMGRFAFNLWRKLPYMKRDTLQWRVREWLEKGCESVSRLDLGFLDDNVVVVVVGDDDKALPSLEEGRRMQADLGWESVVVQGAGHGGTMGGRVNLDAIVERKWLGGSGEGEVEGEGRWRGMRMREGWEGMEGGMSPLLYWRKDVYKKPP